MVVAIANLFLRRITTKPVLTVLLALTIIGCADMPMKMDTSVKYRNDIPFCVKNFGCFEGVTVLPRMPEYEFELAPKGDAEVNFFVVTTCNRNKSFEPGDKGFSWDVLGLFGGKKKGLRYTYVPLQGKEDDGDCPLTFHTYEKTLGRHAWALIRFEHPKYTLPATLYCDGETRNFSGVSLCQAKKGLRQWIKFPAPVKIVPGTSEKGSPCPPLTKEPTGDYSWKMAQDECGYTIQTQDGRLHDLTTTGYVGEVIRELK